MLQLFLNWIWFDDKKNSNDEIMVINKNSDFVLLLLNIKYVKITLPVAFVLLNYLTINVISFEIIHHRGLPSRLPAEKKKLNSN